MEDFYMMMLFVIGALAVLIGAVLFFKKDKATNKKLFSGASAVAALIGVALCVLSCVRTIPTGHTGIVTTFGSVENYTFEAGVHFTAPWHTVVNMDNRNQKATVPLRCFSSDIQEVSVVYSLNYQIEKSNAQKIYKEIGTDYFGVVINPRIEDTVKSVIAQYTADEILDSRSELSENIKNILTDKLSVYNIEVLDTSLEDIDFTDAFTDAVEAKQVAEQRSKQAKIEEEQKTMEAEASAKRAEIEAEAEAKVAKIAAQAELDVVKIQADAAEYAGQKDAAVIGQIKDILAVNKDKLTTEDVKNLLLYYYVQKWNGEFPETYFSSEDFYKLLESVTK